MKKRLLSLCLIIVLILGITAIPDNTFVTNSTTVSAATFGQKQALKKAKSYLRVMALSKRGLMNQLEYEGFSYKECKYGAKHCKANWKKQAAKKAKSYLKVMAFSKSSLYDQLIYEGFTKSQARYGVKKAYK